MRSARVTVINPKGLHARATARFVKVASDYKSRMRMGQTNMVYGKSVLSLMMLAAIKGSELKIETEGTDEDIATLFKVVGGEFGENK